MFGRIFVAALLALTTAAFTADEDDVNVTVKGTLHADKFGYFVQANGGVFDLVFNETGKADMERFNRDLKGDLVQVSGKLYVDDDGKAKPRMTVYANDISRVKRAVVVTERVVTTPPPVIVREEYIVHKRHGVDLPGIHIHW